MRSAARKARGTTSFEDLPAMLGLDDIATHLNVHVETIRRARRGRLHGFPRGIRLRGLVRIPRGEYEQWLDSLREIED
jgi:hypothetical protein